MNEEQIAAQVAKNIPKEEHIPAPVVEDETPQPSAFDSNVALNDPLLSLRIADYFEVPNIDRYNEETQRQLRNVYSWAADIVQSADLDKVLPVIQMLENELGLTFKPNKLQRMARWVQLHKQSLVLRAQMEGVKNA